MGNLTMIAVDCGKYATKYAYSDKVGKTITGSFLSNVEDAGISGDFAAEKKPDAIIELEGKKVLIGKGCATDVFDNSSKKDFRHKACCYAAIAKAVENGASVHIVVGCPLNIYSSKEKKQEYLDYLIPRGENSFTYNGQPFKVYIKKRHCFPESTGFMYLNPGDFTDSTSGIVDIGGLNVNACIYDMGSLDTEKLVTNKLGGIYLRDELKTSFSNEPLIDELFSDLEMDKIMRAGFIKDRDKREISERMIKDKYSDRVSKIIASCTNAGWNMNRLDAVYFIGGTSALLKEQILEKVPGAIITDDSSFANAKGFLKRIRSLEGLSTN